jgi:hypothetical protein
MRRKLDHRQARCFRHVECTGIYLDSRVPTDVMMIARTAKGPLELGTTLLFLSLR